MKQLYAIYFIFKMMLACRMDAGMFLFCFVLFSKYTASTFVMRYNTENQENRVKCGWLIL